MDNDILVTTTNTLDGYRVVKYISPINANIVFGINIINELFAGFTDILGGRSETYQNKLSGMYEIAINQLKEEAKKLKGNCILGLKIDFDEISGKNMSMFMLNAIGTAVIIQNENEQRIIMERKENAIAMVDFLKTYPDIAKEAESRREIYGENSYLSFIKDKAKELGIYFVEDI
jgi:uncharacterized protein YbjQ (UPF0145 family)